MDNENEKPNIDYAKMPFQPRDGVQGKGKGKYLTKSLFLETSALEAKPDALWTLQEHEVFAFGKWYPSAWMIYIHAVDEYDALRKICGNVKQWERIKSMREPKNMEDVIGMWHTEWNYLQRTRIREQLEVAARVDGSVTAMRTMLQLLDGPKPMGRPKKVKEKPPVEGLDEDLARLGLTGT